MDMEQPALMDPFLGKSGLSRIYVNKTRVQQLLRKAELHSDHLPRCLCHDLATEIQDKPHLDYKYIIM